MKCADHMLVQSLLGVLEHLLQFSPEERQRVEVAASGDILKRAAQLFT